MSLLRHSPMLRTFFTPRTIRPSTSAFFSTTRPTLATQDYGSGSGDPVGEKPQEQGKNPKSHMEHPGPKAPDTGDATNNKPPPGDKTEEGPAPTRGTGIGPGGNAGGQEAPKSGGK